MLLWKKKRKKDENVSKGNFAIQDEQLGKVLGGVKYHKSSGGLRTVKIKV